MFWTGPWRFARLAMTVFVVIAGVLAGSPETAKAAPYAAFVMDARTGEVLHASNADKRLHPASLTKMMTLYLAIEAVKAGRLSLDQEVRISSLAARQPPSKMGLRAGSTVSIRNLMRAAAVKSANDAAVALAEATAGSVENWAQLATARAHSMGMSNTTFKNPNGLTQDGHLSTARDMAVLGRRLFFDHPEYYNLFSRTETTAMGRTIHATNRRLLASYRGADGIKTGYTRAAGFNLVASAHRGEQHIIASVFGARSSADRTEKISDLLDLGFNRSPQRTAIIPPRNAPKTRMASIPAPPDRPDAPKSLFDRVGAAIAPAAMASERPTKTAAAVATSQAPSRAPAPRVRPVTLIGLAANMPPRRP